MQNENGFTLIETLFVLFIICMTSLFTMSFRTQIKNPKQTLQEIQSFLYDAKLESMILKHTTTVCFTKNRIFYYYGDVEKEYILDKDSYFDEHELTYNEYGHIKGAKTICFYIQDKQYQFVYQVGSGSFYVK